MTSTAESSKVEGEKDGNNKLQIINNKLKWPNFTRNFSNILTRIMRLFHLFTRLRRTFSQVFRSRLPLSSTVLCKTNPISPPTHRPNTKKTQILPPKSIYFSSTLPLFFSFSSQKCAFFVMFCNFLTLAHLTPYTTKTYINISPRPNRPSSTTERRATRDQRRINMQNEPNYNTPNKLKSHPAMPDSTNNQLSIINNQCKGEPNS